MSASIPFIRGRDCTLKLYQDGQPVYVSAKNFDVTENAVEANDGVCGEDRDRLDKVTNFFSCNLDVYQTDVAVIRSVIAAQKVDDAAGLPMKQTAAVQVRMHDGTRAVFLMKECKFGPATVTSGSRTDNVMLNLKIRCRYFEEAQSAF